MDNCGTRVFVLLAIAILVAGVVSYALLKPPSDYEYEREAMSLEIARTLQPWLIGFRIALSVILVAGLAGIIRAAIHRLEKDTNLFYPDERGQFPARLIHHGEALVDINRLADGKAVTGVVGGRIGLLLILLFRHILKRPVPELSETPVVLVMPHDTSPEQMAVTDAAQRAQLASAVFGGSPARPPAQVMAALLASVPQAQPAPDRLPPWLDEGQGPREIQLLLQAARQQWLQGGPADMIVDTATSTATAQLGPGGNHA